MKVRKFTVTVRKLERVSSSDISAYIEEAVGAWGRQWSDQYGTDPRYQIAASDPKVSIGRRAV